MCLAVPVQVMAVNRASDTAEVSLSGVRTHISIALLEDVAVGDYVLVHVGFALQRLDATEAEATLALFAIMDDVDVAT